ncbi:hypothetical protein TanjilG_11388 [Lupinus angustifolius]|uniref:Senescence regulator n=1 Tax=Lupinus angustifolius TaxID=3871 RepID=A0A1J7IMQ2_LUPAN|nr:PREDICTED: uncharacterized protein LOC109344574 [Lupinus angustifolius]OIW14043.1 hypothetical protein TanjilG_11388 [Lupinus angustifolius]
MAEEFLESEILFSDNNFQDNSIVDKDDMELEAVVLQKEQKQNSQMISGAKKWNGDKKVASSLPIRIPERMLNCLLDDDDGEMVVPPHVMVERRNSGRKMAYSLCTGYGRTLKGRDLSRVRNSILRMTGFLEV